MKVRIFLTAILAVCAMQARAASDTDLDSLIKTLREQSLSESVSIAKRLIGTPYRWGGTNAKTGFDCSGLIGYVYKSRAGIAPPRTVAQLSGFGERVDTAGLRTGDLVIFGSGKPFHAGIYVGEGRFVHAPSTGGTVRLDRLNNAYWARQPTAFRRP